MMLDMVERFLVTTDISAENCSCACARLVASRSTSTLLPSTRIADSVSVFTTGVTAPTAEVVSGNWSASASAGPNSTSERLKFGVLTFARLLEMTCCRSSSVEGYLEGLLRDVEELHDTSFRKQKDARWGILPWTSGTTRSRAGTTSIGSCLYVL